MRRAVGGTSLGASTAVVARSRRPRRAQVALTVAAAIAVVTAGVTVPLVAFSHRTGAMGLPEALRGLGRATWRILPAPPPPQAVEGAPIVWTGQEVIVWGGTPPDGRFPPNSGGDGLAYRPVTGIWRRLPPAPVVPTGTTEAVWTGRDMIVAVPEGERLAMIAYSPATNRWRHLPAPPVGGSSAYYYRLVQARGAVLLYGYPPDQLAHATGLDLPAPRLAVLHPGAARWQILTPPPQRPPHTADGGFTVVWDGSRLLVFTQRMRVHIFPNGVHASTGGSTVTSFDLGTDRWTTLRSRGPVPPLNGSGFWAGRVVAVFGGVACIVCHGPGLTTTRPVFLGGVFDPSTRKWRGAHPPAALNASGDATAWTRVLVSVTSRYELGGHRQWGAVASAWDPNTARWLPVPAPPARLPIVSGTGVWTGREWIFPTDGPRFVALIPGR